MSHLRLLTGKGDARKVELPYRVIDVAAGDLGASAARKYDCEAWVPDPGRYRELTSTSQLAPIFRPDGCALRLRADRQAPATFATLNARWPRRGGSSRSWRTTSRRTARSCAQGPASLRRPGRS